MIAGIEPFAAAAAVEAHVGSHLDEGATLRKFRGFFEFDADQGDALILLLHVQCANRDGIAIGGLTDGTPFSGSKQSETHQKNGSQRHGCDDEGGFFQIPSSLPCLQNIATHFQGKERFCQIGAAGVRLKSAVFGI
jgi:hypothetical protein